MESYPPEWRNQKDSAGAIRRARLVMVDAPEVCLTSSECRTAVLCKKSERLRVSVAGAPAGRCESPTSNWGGPAMTRFVRRLAADVAVTLVPMAAVMVATPGVASAQCDPNWSRNVWTNECRPLPPPPSWWTAPPSYAPMYAPQWVPPPPYRRLGCRGSTRYGTRSISSGSGAGSNRADRLAYPRDFCGP
jgi:hypothetical protein